MAETGKIRVLIVDDHYMVRKGLIVLLENFADEFEIVGDAGNAEDALYFAKQYQPHVVLMDMLMPETDGIEATERIRKECPNSQVIALTSYSEEDQIQRALKAGAISYLMKNQSILSPEAAQVLIRATTRPQAIGHDLTEREREVLVLMKEGLNNRQIADQLVISNSTVKNHVSNILAKLGTSSRTQAVALAVEHKIVE
jgi:two-component system, NarL family, response regulator LiaR